MTRSQHAASTIIAFFCRVVSEMSCQRIVLSSKRLHVSEMPSVKRLVSVLHAWLSANLFVSELPLLQTPLGLKPWLMH